MTNQIQLFAFLALAAGALVACGGGSSAATTTPAPSAAVGVKTPATVSVVTAN